jgi:hypothetical protein
MRNYSRVSSPPPPKYHMKIILGIFNAKVGRENIFKQLGLRIYIRLVMILVLE